MTAGRDTADESRWPALFRRSRDPIFMLNRRRRVLYVNPAFETLAQVTLNEIRGLVCSTRSSTHALGHLGLTLSPPTEVLDGTGQRVRRAFPGTDRGPPWWDIEFLPLHGEDRLLGIVGRIRVLAAKNIGERRSIPVTWSQLRSQAQQRFNLSLWDSTSPALQRVVQQARHSATTGCPTIIVGEMGVGKKTLARAIHALSSRRELPFVGLDCDKLPHDAIRQILTGHLGLNKPDGAGVVYLYDPASLPRDLQMEIVQLVREHPQVMAGFPIEPQSAVEAGRLFEPLLSALGMLTISLPPLRHRPSELVRLLITFLKRAGDDSTKRSLPPEVIELLLRHSWPGNLDELAKFAGDLFAKCGTQPITPADLPMSFRITPNAAIPTKSLVLDELLERVELRLIQRALDRAKGNKTKAAEMLGVWRPRLLRRIEALGLGSAED